MKADGYLKEAIVYRNVNEDNPDSFRVALADKTPEKSSAFDFVEMITIRSYETVIDVFDLDRPVYYQLRDGTRRKVIYHKKKERK